MAAARPHTFQPGTLDLHAGLRADEALLLPGN
nr:unnamed protein product [Callosobruchus chinensis]